jgi:hypothetical protein
MRNEPVAAVILTSGPYRCFLGAALLVGVGERPEALAEDDDECVHHFTVLREHRVEL